MFCLVGDYAISENFIIANRVLIDVAAIAGVALDGVDNAVFDLLDDANMIGLAVLRTRAAPVTFRGPAPPLPPPVLLHSDRIPPLRCPSAARRFP